MRKHIRQIWARSNEHIRVRRNRRAHKKTGGTPTAALGVFATILGLWLAWMLVELVMRVIEGLVVLAAAILPWVAIVSGVIVVIVAIVAMLGKTKALFGLFRSTKK